MEKIINGKLNPELLNGESKIEGYLDLEGTGITSLPDNLTVGACSFGVKDFVKTRLGKQKEKYTIAEIIELTTGEYGSTVFKEFFQK